MLNTFQFNRLPFVMSFAILTNAKCQSLKKIQSGTIVRERLRKDLYLSRRHFASFIPIFQTFLRKATSYNNALSIVLSILFHCQSLFRVFRLTASFFWWFDGHRRGTTNITAIAQKFPMLQPGTPRSVRQPIFRLSTAATCQLRSRSVRYTRSCGCRSLIIQKLAKLGICNRINVFQRLSVYGYQ